MHLGGNPAFWVIVLYIAAVLTYGLAHDVRRKLRARRELARINAKGGAQLRLVHPSKRETRYIHGRGL